MGMKRFVAADGKYAWYDEEKHKLADGKLVLLKEAKADPAPKKGKK